MRLRSLLFVPGDRPDRFARAVESGADAIILDLEDSVAPDRKAHARDAVGQFLDGPRRCPCLVRVNPANGPFFEADIETILASWPDGVMLPKAEGAVSVTNLVVKRLRKPIPILPIATETPGAIFDLGSFRQVHPYLLGLTWGAEDLPAAIGAASAREEDGAYTPPYQMVRSLTLFAAHSAGVPAIETVFPEFRDLDGLAAYAARGRRDGFTGMMAIHPDQVPVINSAFEPGADDLARARAIIAAFESEPGAGVVALEGRMLDRPHLTQARRIVEQAQKGEE